VVEARNQREQPSVNEKILKVEAVKRVELITAILLSAVVLFILIARATHAGGLWRDESDSVQLALMTTWGDMLEHLQFTSFPVLFPAVIRVYATLFGTSDISLRCFGLMVGVAFVCIAWWHSRTLFNEAPLLSLALIGLNTTFLTVGTWIRGYGLGSVLMVLAFTLTAKLLLQPTARWFAAVLLAYLASMQCLFFDGVLAPAMALAVATVWVFRGRLKPALTLTGVVAVCIITYIPYIKTVSRAKEWGDVQKYPTSFEMLWNNLNAACGAPPWIMPLLWHIIFLALVIGAVWRLKVIWRHQPGVESSLLLFGLLTSLISIAGYYAFLHWLHTLPWPRYFLALICLVAVSVDLIIATLSRFHWVRIARVSLVIALLILLPWAAWPQIILRETNIDLVAEMIDRQASPNDLVVVNPWYLGVSFNRYYHGHTRWITSPELTEHRIHRYDLLKAKMLESDPLSDTKSAIRQTLESGNRVWIVGGAPPPVNDLPLWLHPAPDPIYGWDVVSYTNVWCMQLGALLRTHVVKGDVVLGRATGINANENVPLLVADGWRD
jgi:hypothetical protein